MALADFSVKRPVTVIMFFLGVLLFGFISWYRLPQELYPPITYPQLSVVTFYKDAAPEEMEILITKPIEEAVGTVSGVRRISSTSKEETSLVIAEFNWGTDMDFAALGVREKIDLIKESLPRGCEDPIVMKFNPFELPVMVLNITASKTPQTELVSLVKKVIKNELEKAEGVAACNITGGLTPEIVVEVNHDKLLSKQVALNEVVDAVNKANLNYPAGTIEESFYEYLIRTIGEFKVVKEIDDVIVDIDDRTKKDRFPEFGLEDVKKKEERAIPDRRLVALKDIATAKDSFKDRTSVSRYNKKDNISLSIQKQADANALRVANNIKDAIARLKKSLPKDIRINIVYDQSAFITSAIRGVTDAAWQGGLLAFLVLLFFLRRVKSAAIVTLTIPISIFAVFSLMYFSNISLNMISLGGLALGVGMLVDAGIVVVENIYRYREEEKKSPKEASVMGTNEVSGAVAGSVLTTIVVFLPMVFVIGIAGQLFKELAFTVTFSLLGSWVVAMTLIPILSATERHAPDVTSEISFGGESADVLNRMLAFMYKSNERILLFFLKHRAACISAVLSIFVGACVLLFCLDVEFMPKVDQGQFIIKLSLPPGTRLEVTDSVAKTIESQLFRMEDVQTVTVNIGSNREKKGSALLETMGSHEGQIIVNLRPLKPWWRLEDIKGSRSASTSEILQRLKNNLQYENLNNAKIEYILQESVFKSAFQTGAAVVIEIKGQDLNRLRTVTSEIETKLNKIAGIYSVRDSLIAPAPEIKVSVFKEKAATYNLSVSEIALTAQTAIKGYVATKFKKEGEEIDIRVRLRKQDRDDMAKIRRLKIHSPLGINIPLAEVAYFKSGKGPTEIKRQDQERVVVVTANIFKRSFKDIAAAINSILKGLKLSSGYSAELTGESEQIKESFNSLMLALILSAVLVFMIMASQFESLWQPFIIMLTVPLSIIGVVAALFITHTPLSVMVALGFIILGGVVVDNAIVLIDYINILRREQNIPAYDAVIIASRRRLRPILMTSLTTILGLVPMAFALDEAGKLQQPMAITVMGGLTVTTFLSLVFIPTVYLTCEEAMVVIRKRLFGIKTETAAATAETEKRMPSVTRQEPMTKPGKILSTTEEVLADQKKEAKIKEADFKIELHPPPEIRVYPEKKEQLMLPKKQGPVAEDKSLLPAEDILLSPKKDMEEIGGEERKILPKDKKIEKQPPPVTPLPIKEGEISKGMAGRGGIPIETWDLLSDRQRELIRYLRENRKISRIEYAKKFNISVPTAARDLKVLAGKNILVTKGPAAIGRYYMLREGI